jgi:hypothetical protein
MEKERMTVSAGWKGGVVWRVVEGLFCIPFLDFLLKIYPSTPYIPSIPSTIKIVYIPYYNTKEGREI